MTWRKPIYALHRDVGFATLGLVLVYGVSGIAVNHRHDWNYNQSRETTEVQVGRPAELLASLTPERRLALAQEPSSLSDAEEPDLVQAVTRVLSRPAPPRRVFWRGPDRMSLFFGEGEQDVADYHPMSGTCSVTMSRDRPILRAMNYLHLNEGRRLWTYVADVFALAMIFLALSGVILVRGRRGLWGRGGVLVLAGALVPLLALWLLRG
jgi:uncharacterized protein